MALFSSTWRACAAHLHAVHARRDLSVPLRQLSLLLQEAVHVCCGRYVGARQAALHPRL